jgi:hypothetical protein
MKDLEAPKLINSQSVETLVAQLPEPPVKERQGIEAFYQRIDPGQTHRVVVGEMDVFGWQYPDLHREATVRLSWKDLQNYTQEKFVPATVLGTFLSFGCATGDETTGEIKITETVQENTPNRQDKQAIINYLLAQQTEDGHWVVGGIQRPLSSALFGSK